MKKKSQNFRPARAKKKKRPSSTSDFKRVSYVACGADVSMTSISVAGIAVVNGKVRAAAVSRRWERETDYFMRLTEASKAHDIMIELFTALKVMPELNDVYIAVEEPFAFGMVKSLQSNSIKQQSQISGAFLGGLLRWGWTQIFEIPANHWRKLVADELATLPEFEGMTIHYTKWNPDKKIGKYRAQQWVERFHPKWDGHWPDLIVHSKRGIIPRPEGSKAQGKQSDDRYEAFAIAQWMRTEIRRAG